MRIPRKDIKEHAEAGFHEKVVGLRVHSGHAVRHPLLVTDQETASAVGYEMVLIAGSNRQHFRLPLGRRSNRHQGGIIFRQYEESRKGKKDASGLFRMPDGVKRIVYPVVSWGRQSQSRNSNPA